MYYTARYGVLNEEDYIIPSIKSIYNCVDSIIIVENVLPFIEEKYYTKTGSSIDNTVQLIKDFQEQEDVDNKIRFYQVGVIEGEDPKGTANNIILDLINPDTDVFISIDGDELVKEEEINKAKLYFEEDPGLLAVKMKDLMFWQDFKHLLVFDNQPPVTRMFRYQKDGRYKGIFYRDKTGRPVENSDSIIDCCSFLNRYHFGWVREQSKIIEKRIRTLKGLINMPICSDSLKHLINASNKELENEALLQCKLYTEEYNTFYNERVIEYKDDILPELIGHKFEGKRMV